MKIGARVTIKIIDPKTGKVIKTKRFRSKSYVLAFADGLYCHMASITHTIRDVGNTNRSINPYTWYCDCFAAANDSTHSIVVGTGDTPVAITDYKLATQIAHGAGAGQLNYGATTKIAPATLADKRYWSLVRPFTNGSGSTITVKEVGLYARCTTSNWKFCVVRDVIPGGGVDVPNGLTLSIGYQVYIEL